MITLCVAYMVKNESNNIEFSLNSIKTIADKIIVVDTGSTDDTIKKIGDWCNVNKIEVKIYERNWINFGYNRSELALLARNEGEYSLVLDADMIVVLNGFKKEDLTEDRYGIMIRWVGTGFYNHLLFNNKLVWKSVGVIHEYWVAEGMKTCTNLTTMYIDHDRHGPSRPKGAHDVKLLEQGIIDEPNNARYHFYLANSYRDIGEYKKAIEMFTKRVEMGGWDEEVFYSKYQIAYCFELMNEMNKAKIAYLKAWEFRPTRAEPLCKLASICRKNAEYQQAYLFAQKGMEIPYPKDIIFVDRPTYGYVLRFERSIAAFWIGKYEESIEDCKIIDRTEGIANDVRIVNRQNILYNEQKLYSNDYLSAKFPGEAHHSKLNFERRNEKHKRQNLRDMREIVDMFKKRFDLDLYLTYGTLLGAVRENKFIPNDNDIDLAYVSKFNTEEEVKKEVIDLAWALRHLGLLVKCHNNGGQLRVTVPTKLTVVDIWTSWIENGEYHIIPFRKVGMEQDILPLKNRLFEGYGFLFPNNSEKILDNMYINWQTPITKTDKYTKLEEWRSLL